MKGVDVSLPLFFFWGVVGVMQESLFPLACCVAKISTFLSGAEGGVVCAGLEQVVGQECAGDGEE